MPQPIVMPSFGMYTSEGTLTSWLAQAGAQVEAGQPIAEIETDKSTHELPAPASGTLQHVAAIGTLLKEEAVLGYILLNGETLPNQNGHAVKEEAAPVQAPVQQKPVAAGSDGIKASPIARRLAASHNIDLRTLTGSGPNGRIVEADVMARVNATPKTQEAITTIPQPLPAEEGSSSSLEQVQRTSESASLITHLGIRVKQRQPLSAMRRAIGERLRRSQSTAVSLTLTREVEADKLVAARKLLGEKLGLSIPFDALFAKLLAGALAVQPELNSVIEDNALVIYDEINVGVAVSVQGGLIVPVVHDVTKTSLASVAGQIRVLSERARTNTLRPDDMAGGTATITNLGGFGVDAFTPVLNPPQSCILGIGRIQPRVVAREMAMALANTCWLSLTFDHRVTDGVPAAQALDFIAQKMNDDAYLQALA
jgi:pyruvate dehydrogenase E2 component (dihydrolipoamide acetyltransferase)